LRALALGAIAMIAFNGAVLAGTYSGGNKGGSALNIEVVGQDDLGGRGFNGDVWTHEGFAYVGHWGFPDWAGGNDRFCPGELGSGVAVVNVTDPANPAMVSRLQNPPGTSAEDVVVFQAVYGPMAGHDIAVSGIQTCLNGGHDLTIPRGLQL
jgi:hypothetical protein